MGRPAPLGTDRVAIRDVATSTNRSGQRRRCISTEVELKLAASTADLPELKRALVEMAPTSTGAQSRLISTYYDTPNLALKRHGLTLRVREQGDRFIQTVKAGDPGGGDLLTRGQWEGELAESRPDPEATQRGGQLREGTAR